MLTAVSDTIRPMALLAETLAYTRERGMPVAAGRAGGLESARPFGVIAEALECARASADPRRPAGHLADNPRRGRLSRTTACGPGSA
jgi:hypothetical protein